MRAHLAGIAAATALVVAGCTGSTPAQTTSSAGGSEAAQRHPDILDVDLTRTAPETFSVAVTVSSPYDSSSRYADGWRVLDEDGAVLGEHTLTHDHAGEQPFTRTQIGLTIPEDVAEVTVEGRDQEYGYGGGTVTVPVPHEATSP